MLLAFFVTELIWWFQLSCLCMLTPRYFAVSTSSSTCTCMVYGTVMGFLLLVICIV